MGEITYVAAINQALREEMRRNDSVFLIGEEIGALGGVFGATRGLLDEFGEERVRLTPISEPTFVGAAVGAALVGLRPVVEIMYMDFIAAAMDQIVNQAAKFRYMTGGQAKVPLVVRTQAGSGRHQGPQHSQSLEAWFVHVPGLFVVMPSTPYDAKGLLKASIRNDNPVIFIEHKMLYTQKGDVPEEEYIIPLGKADIKREGVDVTVVATSYMVGAALAASQELADKESISVEVIDPRTLVPLDAETILNSVKKTHHVVVVHEAVERAGWGAEMAAMLIKEAFDYLDAPIVRVAAKNAPIPFTPKLESYIVPGQEDILEAIKSIV